MENPVFLPPPCVCDIQDEGCQIKGSEVCNLTIQTAMDQFPALRGCVCAWEEELCDSIQELAAQCPRTPGADVLHKHVCVELHFSLTKVILRTSETAVQQNERHEKQTVLMGICCGGANAFSYHLNSNPSTVKHTDGLAVKQVNRLR